MLVLAFPQVLLCDTCDAGYHATCLVPPVTIIPEGDWYGPHCVQVNITYYFCVLELTGLSLNLRTGCPQMFLSATQFKIDNIDAKTSL